MRLDAINAHFEGLRGKSCGYPADMRYTITEKADGAFELCVEDAEKGGSIWKLADPWGFAALAEARSRH